ncbi:glycoside hydrolase family protein [Paraburkholderia hayleyella]|uniref:glycoside hydrolase family protein n=1 Tax=Paraburkholderia hayleyella TaxID=2152889 RepID=UPI001290D7A1|nr:glycoside hydrolase family protein [Paraburkholderia hayleyella]
MPEKFDLPMLLAELDRDEGRRLKPYLDTVGKTTIGVGRNLTDVGISDAECDAMLQLDVDRTAEWLDRNLAWWRQLDAVRQRVLLNMAFNLGAGLLTFTSMLAATQHGEYRRAADGMLASKWAVQVGARAQRLATMMKNGST